MDEDQDPKQTDLGDDQMGVQGSQTQYGASDIGGKADNNQSPEDFLAAIGEWPVAKADLVREAETRGNERLVRRFQGLQQDRYEDPTEVIGELNEIA